MTAPIDITDPRVIKALAHPLRLRILSILDGRVASPSEIAEELGTPLSNTSYHVRQLADLGFLKLVDRAVRRGAVEHYYSATVRPTVDGEAWGRVPPVLRHAMVAGGVQQGLSHLATAATGGGFGREDIHYTCKNGRLDAAGWRAVASELAALADRLDAMFAESEERLLASGEPADQATVMLVQFEAATPPPPLLELEAERT
jgi:DNA-binding transcriptional ArsR family regulator